MSPHQCIISYFCLHKVGWWKTHCLWIYSNHAVSWGVNDFCRQHCKKIIRFQIACQSNVRFIHINCFTMENTSLYWFAIVNSWPCHHNDHEVLCCHGSIQQKMHCLWVHCVSFTSFRMRKLTVSRQWEMTALHKRIIRDKLTNVSKVIRRSRNVLSSLEWKYFTFDRCICSHKGWTCYGQMKPPLMISDRTV